MSIIKAIRHQLGLSATAANNFTLDASADDGTMKLARGNAGAGTQDILTVNAAGALALTGTATNDSAAAGKIGEYLENIGTSTGLTTATPAAIAQITLTPGDWDVSASAYFVSTSSTSVSAMIIGPHTSVAFPNFDRRAAQCHSPLVINTPTNSSPCLFSGPNRFSVAANTVIYLVAVGIFTVSTLAATGKITARRVR